MSRGFLNLFYLPMVQRNFDLDELSGELQISQQSEMTTLIQLSRGNIIIQMRRRQLFEKINKESVEQFLDNVRHTIPRRVTSQLFKNYLLSPLKETIAKFNAKQLEQQFKLNQKQVLENLNKLQQISKEIAVDFLVKLCMVQQPVIIRKSFFAQLMESQTVNPNDLFLNKIKSIDIPQIENCSEEHQKLKTLIRNIKNFFEELKQKQPKCEKTMKPFLIELAKKNWKKKEVDCQKQVQKHLEQLDEEDNMGRTALHWSVLRQKSQLMRALLRNGCNRGKLDIYGRRAVSYSKSLLIRNELQS